MKNLLAAAPLHVSGLLALLVACEALGASVRSPSIRADGRFQIQFDAVPGSYAILFRGTSVTTIQNAVALSQTATGLITLIDPEPTPGSSNRFYRVQWVPLDLPRDVDGDGMSDVFELKYPSILNPLNPADRDLDSDGDGRSNFTESLAGTDPSVRDAALTRVETSPFQGASGISVTRETIFRFSQPLASNTTLATNVVYAEVGSRRILSRAELASDRRKITLFYLEPLPASARVRARLDGNQLRDETGSLVDGDDDGVAGGWTEIQFDTMSSVLLTGTAVSGFVYDSAPQQTPSGLTNKPIVGAIVTIDGNEQVGRAVTDSRGFFILNPCPSGRFFVHIDGREAVGSSWPDGAYYPFVGKTFEGVVGQTNPVPGGVVYLPLVAASTLKPVSALTTTTVEFPASVLAGRPELAGVKVTVPANSLFADDGTRGGSVGIAPVPPDRIPSPLPPGLTPPIVITVQTDGPANFDRPVPVQFPNLPDPRTGKILGPGERSVLWSFNHDSGQWEPQGTMTVSADGKFLASDPGVGVLQPGWLAAYPAGQPIPPPNNCPVGSLAKEYLEAQLKEAECMLRMAALLTLPGPSLQIPKLLNLAATLPSLASSMSQSLANLASAVQAGQPAGVVGALFGILSANMNAISQVGSARATTSGTPVQQLLKSLSDLLVCLLELAKEQLDFSCGIVPCLFSNHPNFANQMALCNTMQTGVQQALNAISAYQFKTGSGFTRLTIAMQQLGSLITAYGGTPAGPNALDPHTPGPRLAAAAPLPDQIQAQIKEVLDALAEFQKDVQPETDLANQMAGTLNTYSNVLASLDGPALLRLSAHANGYYKLTSGGFVARGRITPSGALDLPMINFFEPYSLLIYDPLRNAVSEGNAPAPGLSVQPILPDPVLRIPGINDLSGDTDGDGLTDLAEDVIGTRRDVKDTDGDGISDFTEVQQGRNPLNGIALPTGPVSALPLAGTSKSIDIVDTTAYLAQGTAGMAVVDLTNPLSPIAISQFALPGDSYDIAYSPTARTAGLIAYASDAQISQGELYQMHVVDLTDPTRPRLLRNSLISANSIQENDGVFYTAVGNEVRMYDAASGLEIGWFSVNAPVTGILPTESEIFVTTAGNFFVYQKALSSPALKGSIAGKFAAADIQSKVHMVLDGTRLWVGTAQGLLAVDIANRNAPKVLNQPGILPRAFRTLALSAAKRAIGLTTTLPNALNFGGQTSIFDISDPTSTNKLNLFLNARGRTYDSAMLSGWCVLADGQAGLTVMNLLSLDTAGQAPSVTWLLDTNDADASKQGVQMVEGRPATFRPTVTDDVEVDFTELLVNGSVVDVSRVIPPVFEFQLPVRTQNITQITAQIQSRDRSGNLGSSDSVTIELIADTVSPTTLSPTQQSGFAAFSNWPLVFRFSEDLLPEAWQASAMNLLSYGPNGVIGGGDDVTIQLASANVTGASASVIPASPLTFGRYRLTIPRGQIRDAVSNAPPSDLVLEFNAFVTDPATAIWISPNPGRYHDAANWLRARVPGQENVLIQLPGATPTVTLDAATVTKDITVGGALTLSSRFAGLAIRQAGLFKGVVQANGGSITVMNTARFDADLSLQGVDVSVSGTLDTRGKTTLNGGSMSLSGANATWLRPGGMELKNGSIFVRDGAVAQFPEFTSLQSDGDFTGLFPFASSFSAIGIGSKLVFPNAVSGTGPTGSSFTGAPFLEFSASGGGVIEAPLLQSLTGRVRLNADGTDSKLELPKLTRIDGPVDFASQINAFNFAEIRAPLLASLKKCDVRLTDSVLRVLQIQIESANNLRGYGTIVGNVEIQGSLLLDFAGGGLIVDGNLTFTSSSIYSPALGQTFGPAFVEVRKQAVLNGKLKPTLERGFAVKKGDTFVVGKFPGGVTGSFAQLDPSALGASVVFDAPMASGNLSVRITGP